MTATTEAVNPNVVTLVDSSTPFGVSVNFGAKAKTQVITEEVSHPEAGYTEVFMNWAFRNGSVTKSTFVIPHGTHVLSQDLLDKVPALLSTESAHGRQQKIGDSYAQVKEADDVQMVVEVTLENLAAGRWAKQSEGGNSGITGLDGNLIEGVRRTFAGNGKEEFADPAEGKVLARAWLVNRYNKVLDEAAALRIPTGDDMADKERVKAADELTKYPFKKLCENTALQSNLATIRREKAEATEAAKRKALADTGFDFSEFE
jgi:hypothetical protein